MFKLAGFGMSRVVGSEASACFFNTASKVKLRYVFSEKSGEAERAWPVGCEGGVLPELKMAAVGAAPRNFTSGFGAAGASGLALAPPYGIGVRRRGAAGRGQTGKQRSGRGPCPHLGF